MAVFGALRGIREGPLDPLLPHNFPEKRSTIILHDLPRITMSFVFRKPMRRMNSCNYWRIVEISELVDFCLSESPTRVNMEERSVNIPENTSSDWHGIVSEHVKG